MIIEYIFIPRQLWLYCRNCVDTCPSQAIHGKACSEILPWEELVDVRKRDQWKIKNFPEFHGQVCGICVAVCPHGQRARRLGFSHT
ncbi:hypothetical protein HSX37_12585|uniref:4Fe-4S double cluster binding domain-containing protein n=1 Tax=Dendrosporobacter quercicolus TaxID=146817 RepID=UPI000B871220|nr:4Fe-4S double cluster binding domain-containing protein [Dendrosporobacter quercicolus]NSL48871.1 hypothetical protein [Dendrosporobacter quercicolus DSM 1736]